MPEDFTSMGTCRRCGHELAPGALTCSRCLALVHADELKELSNEAGALEEANQHERARQTWEKCLRLLPSDSNQAIWIRAHANLLEPAPNFALLLGGSAPEQHELATQEEFSQPGRKDPPAWVRRLGPLAPLTILLLKGKTIFFAIFKLKFMLSFFSFFWIYWLMWGPRFGLGFALMILIHELGHYIDIKRRGLPADMPVFLPGLGAYVRWQAMGVSADTRAAISLAGPLAGYLASVVAAWMWVRTGNALYAGLAHLNTVITVLNLVPVWILDGSQAAQALNHNGKILLLTASLAVAAIAGQPILLAVAVGFAWQVFRKDARRGEPEQSSNYIVAYYAALLILLALLLRVIPDTKALG